MIFVDYTQEEIRQIANGLESIILACSYYHLGSEDIMTLYKAKNVMLNILGIHKDGKLDPGKEAFAKKEMERK